MFDFVLDNLPQVILVAVGALAAIAIFIASLFEGRSFKKSFKEFKENLEMIIPKQKSADHQQTFSEFEKDYILDEKTGELLEKEFPRNVQKEIDSHKDVALNVQLARLLPDPAQTESDVDEYYQARGDLDDVMNAQNAVNEIREAYGLPETATLKDIREYVDKIVNDLKAKIVNPDASAQEDNKKEASNEKKVSSEQEKE